MVEERKKRAVAFEKTISGLTPEDVRVKVVGTIIEKDDSNNSILMDNGDAKLRVLLDAELFSKSEIGKLIRVTGIVAPSLIEGSQEVELKGEMIQDFSKLDKELYKQFLALNCND